MAWGALQSPSDSVSWRSTITPPPHPPSELVSPVPEKPKAGVWKLEHSRSSDDSPRASTMLSYSVPFDKYSLRSPTRPQSVVVTDPVKLEFGNKHDRFYLPDGNVLFRVEKTLYCVHRYFFQQYSKDFALKYKLCDLSNPGTPAFVHLEDVETRDFDQLLSIFYPSTWVLAHPETKTVDQWTSILRLATKWNFTCLRELAVERLFDIASSIEKVVLGNSFDLPHWLPLAYAELCERETPLSIEEGRHLFKLGQIGGDVMILLNQARHKLSSERYADVDEVVRDIFGLVEVEPPTPPLFPLPLACADEALPKPVSSNGKMIKKKKKW